MIVGIVEDRPVFIPVDSVVAVDKHGEDTIFVGEGVFRTGVRLESVLGFKPCFLNGVFLTHLHPTHEELFEVIEMLHVAIGA